MVLNVDIKVPEVTLDSLFLYKTKLVGHCSILNKCRRGLSIGLFNIVECR